MNETKKPSIVGMGMDPAIAKQVYDAWAKNEQYSKDIREWGYDTPERVAELLKRYLTPPEASILDTGAGDGLSGMALQKVGYSNIVGSDISMQMLKIADQRGCYKETKTVDLSKPLSYDTDSFDAVTCVGTLTYVDPTAGTLQEFVRITKPGGFVCYSNRTDKADQWKEEERSLEEKGRWKQVEMIGPVPYLPKNEEYGEKIQVIVCLFRVL